MAFYWVTLAFIFRIRINRYRVIMQATHNHRNPNQGARAYPGTFGATQWPYAIFLCGVREAFDKMGRTS